MKCHFSQPSFKIACFLTNPNKEISHHREAAKLAKGLLLSDRGRPGIGCQVGGFLWPYQLQAFSTQALPPGKCLPSPASPGLLNLLITPWNSSMGSALSFSSKEVDFCPLMFSVTSSPLLFSCLLLSVERKQAQCAVRLFLESILEVFCFSS